MGPVLIGPHRTNRAEVRGLFFCYNEPPITRVFFFKKTVRLYKASFGERKKKALKKARRLSLLFLLFFLGGEGFFFQRCAHSSSRGTTSMLTRRRFVDTDDGGDDLNRATAARSSAPVPRFA